MITFNNKTTLNSQPDIANENKVTASDMNEIKSVYNTEIGDVSNLITTATNVVDAINESVGKISILWSGSKSTTGNITLSEAYTNYDFLLVGIQAQSYSKGSELIPTSDIVQSTGGYNGYEITIFQSTSVYANMSILFTNATTLNIVEIHRASWNDCTLKYVIGIKL